MFQVRLAPGTVSGKRETEYHVVEKRSKADSLWHMVTESVPVSSAVGKPRVCFKQVDEDGDLLDDEQDDVAGYAAQVLLFRSYTG